MTVSVRNIVIAVVMAVAAAVLVLVYTTSYKDQVTRQQERVKVLVATRQIDEGTDGAAAASSMQLREVLRADVAPGALTATGGLDGKVASQTIYPGQQVVADVFQTVSTQRPQLQLDKTDRGIRLNLDTTEGVIGDIQAGDRIDLFAAIKLKDAVSGNEHWIARRVLEKVLVLEAPAATDGEKKTKSLSDRSNNSGGQDVMLDVSQADATKLVWLGAANGDAVHVWLVVRPPEGKAQEQDKSLENDLSILFDGVSPAEIRKKISDAASRDLALSYVAGRTRAVVATDGSGAIAGTAATAPTGTTTSTDGSTPGDVTSGGASNDTSASTDAGSAATGG